MHAIVLGSTPVHHEIARGLARAGHTVQYLGQPCDGLEHDLRPAKVGLGRNVGVCDLASNTAFSGIVLAASLRVPERAQSVAFVWGGGSSVGGPPEQPSMDDLSWIMNEYMVNPTTVWHAFHSAMVKARRPYHTVTLGFESPNPHPARAGMLAAQAEFSRALTQSVPGFLPGARSTLVPVPAGFSPRRVFDECVSPILT